MNSSLHDDDDDDDDDGDGELFYGMVDQRKAFNLPARDWPLWEILTIVNLRHALSMIWVSAEPEFRFS